MIYANEISHLQWSPRNTDNKNSFGQPSPLMTNFYQYKHGLAVHKYIEEAQECSPMFLMATSRIAMEHREDPVAVVDSIHTLALTSQCPYLWTATTHTS